MEIALTIPTSWNELTDKQFLGISELMYQQGELFDLPVFMLLNNIKWYQFTKAYQLKLVLRNVGVSELKKHCSFIYKEDNRTIFPKLKGYTPPMDRIIDLTIEEFAVADDLNNNYLKTKERKYLVALCAVLYKKKNEEYNHLDLNKLSKRFKHASGAFLLAVHNTWNGCKNYIMNRYKKVFPKVKTQVKKSKGAGFLEVILKMSGAKFGTHSETKKTLVYTFMTEFQESIIQQEKWEEMSRTKR